MKINDANVGGLGSSGIQKTQEAEHSAKGRQLKPAEAQSGSTDRVQLSQLSESVRASDSGSPERAARLQALTDSVQAGRYHVDSTVLSKNIIKDAGGE
jgi:anti-sigma28 factor (negative regulator of flagellin synthesis)